MKKVFGFQQGCWNIERTTFIEWMKEDVEKRILKVASTERERTHATWFQKFVKDNLGVKMDINDARSMFTYIKKIGKFDLLNSS